MKVLRSDKWETIINDITYVRYCIHGKDIFFIYDKDNNLIEVIKADIECDKENLRYLRTESVSSRVIEFWFNKKGLCVCRLENGFEELFEYNDDGHIIHYKNSRGYEKWSNYSYDYLGNIHIHEINVNGFESWTVFDKDRELLYIKNSKGKETYFK